MISVRVEIECFYLHWRFKRSWVSVVRQALAVALLFNTQQDLNVFAVLIAAGLLVTLHPRLDFILPQRRVLCWLLLWSCTLEITKQFMFTLRALKEGF